MSPKIESDKLQCLATREIERDMKKEGGFSLKNVAGWKYFNFDLYSQVGVINYYKAIYEKTWRYVRNSGE